MSGCPSSGKIAIGADFDFLNFRVPPQKCFQRGRLFEGKGLRFLSFLGENGGGGSRVAGTVAGKVLDVMVNGY